MSFTEKSAWISFVSILLVSAVYFWRVAGVIAGDAPATGTFGLFISLVVVLVVLEIVLHVAAALHSPKDAQTAEDERDRLIALKATRYAFLALFVGALLAIGTLHLGVSSWVLAHCVLLALVIAELVKFGGQILHYRRGA